MPTWRSRQWASLRRSRPAPSSCVPAATSRTWASTGPATLHLETLWIRDITVTTGLVDTTPTLRMLANHQLQTESFITHRFDLQEMQSAYEVFSAPEETGALKVGLFRN